MRFILQLDAGAAAGHDDSAFQSAAAAGGDQMEADDNAMRLDGGAGPGDAAGGAEGQGVELGGQAGATLFQVPDHILQRTQVHVTARRPIR